MTIEATTPGSYALEVHLRTSAGDALPPVVIDDESDPRPDAAAPAAQCPAQVIAAGSHGSVARRWDEQALAAIRRDGLHAAATRFACAGPPGAAAAALRDRVLGIEGRVLAASAAVVAEALE